jgi:hypothetical protein
MSQGTISRSVSRNQKSVASALEWDMAVSV